MERIPVMEKIIGFFKSIYEKITDFTLQNLFPAIVVFVIGFLAIMILMKLLNKVLNRSKLEKPAATLILSVIRVGLFLLLFLISASSLGIDVSGIIALASVLTLAISLALQDALANVIGGFTLLSTKPFRVGDYVEISGEGGTVLAIGLTYTQLLTPDRKTISIPNRNVIAASVVNYTLEGTRRVDISIQAAYSNDPEQVIAALMQAADTPTAMQEPAPYAALSSYGESTMGYILQIWCKSEDYWTTLHTVNRNIRKVFEQSGIQMTYPHLNVHLDK